MGQIQYSEKYFDDTYEYRHVVLPPEVAKLLPKNRLLSENEWRAIGVQQSRGWVHYAIHRPEPHIMLFRRPLNYQQQQDAAAQQAAMVNLQGLALASCSTLVNSLPWIVELIRPSIHRHGHVASSNITDGVWKQETVSVDHIFYQRFDWSKKVCVPVNRLGYRAICVDGLNSFSVMAVEGNSTNCRVSPDMLNLLVDPGCNVYSVEDGGAVRCINELGSVNRRSCTIC
ncbi:hypothetical protein ACET3Z_019615 [Daucus carota]